MRLITMSSFDIIKMKSRRSWEDHLEKDGGNRIHACFRDELDNVVEEEDGGWNCFLGGNNSSGTKKYQGSNSSDGGNTKDGVKIAGGVIGSCGGIGSLNFEDILGATTQRDTGSYYPKRYWELLPKEILGAITQRETGISYGKME
ncbi:hypothetical protein Tco_0867925, partial [Tanacetum coccineum]